MEESKARVTKAVDELIEFGDEIIRCRKCDEVLSDSKNDSAEAARKVVYLHLKLKHDLIGNLLGGK